MLHSEQKCAHFCSEWSIVGYGTGAFWDLWNWSIVHISFTFTSTSGHWASRTTLKNMDKWVTQIDKALVCKQHKTEQNRTVCIFHGTSLGIPVQVLHYLQTRVFIVLIMTWQFRLTWWLWTYPNIFGIPWMLILHWADTTYLFSPRCELDAIWGVKQHKPDEVWWKQPSSCRQQFHE